MSIKQYLQDYYSNSPQDTTWDQIKNFGSEAGGGKSFTNGLLSGITDGIRIPANAAASLEGNIIGKLSGKDMSQNTLQRQNQINDFFKIDALQPSVNEYPTLDTLGNTTSSLFGGNSTRLVTGLPKNAATSIMNKNINQAANTAEKLIDKSIAREQDNTHPNTLAGIGSAILNGTGNIIKQPIKLASKGTHGLADLITGKDSSLRTNDDLNKIDQFFKF